MAAAHINTRNPEGGPRAIHFAFCCCIAVKRDLQKNQKYNTTLKKLKNFLLLIQRRIIDLTLHHKSICKFTDYFGFKTFGIHTAAEIAHPHFVIW